MYWHENPGTNPHITGITSRTGVNSTTGVAPPVPLKPVTQTVVGAPLFDVNAEDLDLDDL